MKERDLYGNLYSELMVDFERDLAAMEQEYEDYYSKKISEHSNDAKKIASANKLAWFVES